MRYKQAILVRRDLGMPKGKTAAQVAHASLEAALKAEQWIVDEWRLEGAKKVVLKVENLAELKRYLRMAKAKQLPTALITDQAKTFFKRPTVTCLAIGPVEEEVLDELTKELPLL
ncbi:peptidyl-tRNA hydrolase [Candidatus Woesearchaeota archaeon]|mgnify:CR=1 FL=1|nr:MAG: peptidyl-tRNA hydrolase [Candidatus Woesearchaeota archaeon]